MRPGRKKSPGAVRPVLPGSSVAASQVLAALFQRREFCPTSAPVGVFETLAGGVGEPLHHGIVSIPAGLQLAFVKGIPLEGDSDRLRDSHLFQGQAERLGQDVMTYMQTYVHNLPGMSGERRRAARGATRRGLTLSPIVERRTARDLAGRFAVRGGPCSFVYFWGV